MRSRILLGAVVAAGAVFLLRDPGVIGALVRDAGDWAPAVLLAIWVLGTPLLLPGPVVCAVAGLVLGPVGIAVSLVGSPLGALLAFGLARHLGGQRLAARLPDRVNRTVARLERGGVLGVAGVRMLPGLPVGVFNYACGASRLRPGHFVVGSALGAAPRVLLYGTAGGAVLRLFG